LELTVRFLGRCRPSQVVDLGSCRRWANGSFLGAAAGKPTDRKSQGWPFRFASSWSNRGPLWGCQADVVCFGVFVRG